MTATIMPNGKHRFYNLDGTVLVGGKLFTYAAGTVVPKATYVDQAATIPNTNPVILDIRGEALVRWDGAYKYVLTTAAGVVIETIDDFTPNSALIGGAGAGLIGFNYASVYPNGSIGKWLQGLATSVGAGFIGFLQNGAGAVLRTVMDKLRDTVSVSDYGTFQQALTAAAGKTLNLNVDVVLTANQIADLSVCTNTTITGTGKIIGPVVGSQAQPTAYLKIWGSLGAAVPFGSAIAEAASAFAVAQTFAANDLLMLSNFPTDATDAYTEGGADVFGQKARSYATFSPANLRQTRRKELLVVRNATGANFNTTMGTTNAYPSTASLQFQKVTPVQNLKFIGVTFENVHIDLQHTRNVAFIGCVGLSTVVVGKTAYNTSVDFAEFNARDTDCRADFYEACRGLHFSGSYKNINTPSDNAIIKALGCFDITSDVRIEGCKGSAGNGFMVDTAFTENPSGYSDLPTTNFRLHITAKGCDGAGAVVTCDPYASKASYGQVFYSSDDTGCFVKGGDNIDLYANISSSDGANNSIYLYGATNTNIYGKQRGGIFNSIVTNPRNGAQTQGTSGTSKHGSRMTAISQPAFIGYATAAVASATGDGTEVGLPISSKLIDKTNSLVGGVFTAPEDGMYRFDATVKLNNVGAAHTSGWLRLFAGGTSFYFQPSPAKLADATGNCGMSFAAMAYMTMGQTAQMFVQVGGGTKVVGIQGSGLLETFISGTLLN